MNNDKHPPRVAIISPFTRYSGHHLTYTRELAENLLDAGILVDIHTTACAATLRTRLPRARVYEISLGFAYIFRIFDLDRNRTSKIFTLLQNLETFSCALSLVLHIRGVKGVYWQDSRHYIMLLFVSILPFVRHVNLVLGGLPFGPVGNMRLGVEKLYQLAMAKNRLIFVAETEHVQEEWSSLAKGQAILIPVAIGQASRRKSLISREVLQIQDSAFVCLQFGTHRADKDYVTLIKAAAASVTQPFLIFAGPLISSNDPAKLMTALNYNNGIVINRFMAEEESADYFHISDCALLPYAKGYEKGSAVLLQACKYNIPVIAAGTGHLQRFIEKFRTGVTYEPENVRSLAAAIDLLAAIKQDDPGRWQNGLEACRKHYSWSGLIGKYAQALNVAAHSPTSKSNIQS